jgi:adenylate kinase family enzyme
VVGVRLDELGGARRIVVYGVTGAGKSTLAAQIAQATGIPWHAVDDLTWRPGWTEVPIEEQRRLITAICAKPEWVLDAAYGQWLDIPMSHGPVVVALDYPRWLSWQRVVRRTVSRLIRRTPICNGNYETLRRMLSPRDSIIGWHHKSFAHKRSRIRAWEADPGGPAVLPLRSPRATRAFLAGLRIPSGSPR